MAQYSKITKISDVIDKHFVQNASNNTPTDVISAMLATIIGAEMSDHIVHLDINQDTLCVTVNDQSVRQLLQLQAGNIIHSMLRQTDIQYITKVKIMFDTQSNNW